MRRQRSTPSRNGGASLVLRYPVDVSFKNPFMGSTFPAGRQPKRCINDVGMGSLPWRSRILLGASVPSHTKIFVRPPTPCKAATRPSAVLRTAMEPDGRNGQVYFADPLLVPGACEGRCRRAAPDERLERQVAKQCHEGRAEVDDQELHKSPAAK